MDDRRACKERCSAEVLFVYPRSAAAEAGLNVGDELTGADDKCLTNDQWHDLFAAPTGTVVSFRVRENGKTNPKMAGSKHSNPMMAVLSSSPGRQRWHLEHAGEWRPGVERYPGKAAGRILGSLGGERGRHLHFGR